ncbi:hypothetical protein HA402_004391 [Bradysia odoriphaga]|nr:hypothetical protein HA402_004391 [Bradysia odoriphaga]
MSYFPMTLIPVHVAIIACTVKSPNGGVWFIKELGLGGKLQPQVEDGNYDHFYAVQFPFSLDGKTYIYGQNSISKKWRIQHILSGGTLGAEKDTGSFDRFYEVQFSFQIGDRVYAYGQSSRDKHYQIKELLCGGKFGKETDSGDLKSFYAVQLSFSVDGQTYLYGQDLTCKEWFIRRKIGRQFHFSLKGQTFLFGQNLANKKFVIRRLLPDGITGDITASGELKEAYQILLPYSIGAPLYLLPPNFITTSITDVTNYLRRNGFQQKNVLGFAATNSYDCNGNTSLIPIYRFHNNITLQYILSSNPSPPKDTTLPYTADGIAFYASDTFNTNCGPTAPLHSYWVQTHFVYTTDKESADAVLVEMEGGTYKGIICHFWLTDKPPVILTTTTIPTTTASTTTVPTTTTSTTTVPTTTTSTTTVPTTTASTTTIPPPPHCPVNTVPLWRLYRPLSNNHFYTTSEPEAQNAVSAYSYVREGSSGTVAKSASDCSCERNFVPVYRLYRPGRLDDHFYTASEDEAIKAQSTYGYTREGIEYYCSLTRDACGATIPLYRYWRGTDHFYTANIDEGNRNVIPFGGIFEGIVCYIWP